MTNVAVANNYIRTRVPYDILIWAFLNNNGPARVNPCKLQMDTYYII